MADHTITITNSVNLFGGHPSSKWNEHNWNEFNWGYGTVSYPLVIYKCLGNSISTTDAITEKIIGKNLNNSTTLNELLAKSVTKPLTETLSLSELLKKAVEKPFDNSITLSDTLTKLQNKNIANTLDVSADMYEEKLIDQNGYEYVFTRPSNNAEDRSNTDWDTESTGDVVTWTCQAAGSTTWS